MYKFYEHAFASFKRVYINKESVEDKDQVIKIFARKKIIYGLLTFFFFGLLAFT